jgi:hypothetical protein
MLTRVGLTQVDLHSGGGEAEDPATQEVLDGLSSVSYVGAKSLYVRCEAI